MRHIVSRWSDLTAMFHSPSVVSFFLTDIYLMDDFRLYSLASRQ